MAKKKQKGKTVLRAPTGTVLQTVLKNGPLLRLGCVVTARYGVRVTTSMAVDTSSTIANDRSSLLAEETAEVKTRLPSRVAYYKAVVSLPGDLDKRIALIRRFSL